MSGQDLYEAWRDAMNRAAARRGNNIEPRWSSLRPWIQRVWEDVAKEMA